MSIFTFNNKSVSEIYTMREKSELIVDDSYQRRSVWGEKDKIRLIETILLDLVIPELFFWASQTDPETGKTITHIVDGQQRINAIEGFIHNEFKLKEQYLSNSSIKEKILNKFFRDLDSSEKTRFWSYRLMIIEFGQEVNRNQIVEIFRRLNLTDYNLNDQEKRNSISGDFAILARDLSELPLWNQYSLFKITDVKRMKDVEFCASLIILCKRGIVDQTDQTILNQAYTDYQTGYTDMDKDKECIVKAVEVVQSFFYSEAIVKFARRKAQLYTLFCIAFSSNREGIEISDQHKQHLNEFVELYSRFSNDLDLTGQLTDEEKNIFDILKKYKLASSEGLNKHTNRMIRQNALKDFLFNAPANLSELSRSLLSKMNITGIQEDVESPDDDL